MITEHSLEKMFEDKAMFICPEIGLNVDGCKSNDHKKHPRVLWFESGVEVSLKAVEKERKKYHKLIKAAKFQVENCREITTGRLIKALGELDANGSAR